MSEPNEPESLLESVDPNHLELIGKVIIRFSELEGWVAQLLRHYSGLETKAAYAITGGLRMRQILEMLPDVVRATQTNERLIDDILSIRVELIAISEERDKVAHWQWMGSAGGWGVTKWLTARKPAPMPEITLYPKSQLKKLHSQMTRLVFRINAHLISDEEWMKLPKKNRDKFWPSPWRDTPLPQDPTPEACHEDRK